MPTTHEELAHVLRAILDKLDHEPPVKAIGAIKWLETEANRLVRSSGLLRTICDSVPQEVLKEFEERAIFHRRVIPDHDDLPSDVTRLRERDSQGEPLSLEEQRRVLGFAPEVLVYSIYGPDGFSAISRLEWFAASTTFDDDCSSGWRQPLSPGPLIPDAELIETVRRCVQNWLFLAEKPIPANFVDYALLPLRRWLHSHPVIATCIAVLIVVFAVIGFLVSWIDLGLDSIERVLSDTGDSKKYW